MPISSAVTFIRVPKLGQKDMNCTAEAVNHHTTGQFPNLFKYAKP